MSLQSSLPWAYISKNDILIEKKQCIEEGKDVSPLLDEFEKYSIEDTPQEILEEFLEKTYNLPTNLNEPSDFESIMALCKGQDDYIDLPKNLEDKVAGAWIGRIVGCQLGKPFEGARRETIKRYLKATDNYPPKHLAIYSEKYIIDNSPNPNKNLYFGQFDRAMPDDDLNYPVLNFKLYKRFKDEIKSENIALGWLEYLPFDFVCTAERVAYKNFTKCIDPPKSATVNNPYREWIGAQIRGDFWGWVNPKSSKKAVKLAFKDASISHIKNGIYGEMFISAMLSNAYYLVNIKDVIEAGLNFVPITSRLYKSINDILRLYENGKTYEEAVEYICSIWDEKNSYDWCHTISNAQIVAVALLWGRDFTDAIGKAILPGFDTDCNGATVGSIMGVFLGINEIDKIWYECFNDTLSTNIADYNNVKILEVIKETVELINN